MTARTMSSDTCQNFCGSGRRKRAGSDRCEGQPGIVNKNIQVAKTLLRHCDDAVAIGWSAQICGERQDMSHQIALRGGCCDLRDVAIDVTDRDDVVTGAREPEYHRLAEAAQPAGDDRDPSFHRCLLTV